MDLESELACHMKMKVISAKGNVSKDMRSYYSNFKLMVVLYKENLTTEARRKDKETKALV